MSKSKRLKEWDEVKKLKQQNIELRRRISKLQKVISRVDFEHYSYIQELLEAHEREDLAFTKKSKKDSLKEKWKCWDCGEGILRLITIFKVGEPYYFRKCDNCNKKTKLQKYKEGIEGIKE